LSVSHFLLWVAARFIIYGIVESELLNMTWRGRYYGGKICMREVKLFENNTKYFHKIFCILLRIDKNSEVEDR
jgi:hypothetical protein